MQLIAMIINQRHSQEGRNASHQTCIEHHLSKDTDRCPFSLSVFQDDTRYFMKTTASSGIHQYHPCHDFLHASASYLSKAELELQEDMNSACAKIGTAAYIHYGCSAHQGTPTLLSLGQIAWFRKKTASSLKVVGNASGIMTGEIYDIYKFLEESGNYYVSLLAWGSTKTTVSLLARGPTKTTAINTSTNGCVPH
jgi:hypothetical protein